MSPDDIEIHPIHLGLGATVRLEPGQYAISEPGTWHTADVEQQARSLFITAGMDTQLQPR
jgi:D-lyxose ketol-isomerase